MDTNNKMDAEIKVRFIEVQKKLAAQFGDDIDLQAILFLIGIQELGQGKTKLNKNEKLDVMHIAICTLLTPYGYYEYKGLDKDGWPHWKVNDKLPPLKPLAQEQLMIQAVVEYFEKNEI